MFFYLLASPSMPLKAKNPKASFGFIVCSLKFYFFTRNALLSAYSEQGIHTFNVSPLSFIYFRSGLTFLLQIAHLLSKKRKIDTIFTPQLLYGYRHSSVRSRCPVLLIFRIRYHNKLCRGGKRMGLFINNGAHPDVYKNNEQIPESNQEFSRKDYLTELINEQQKTNFSLRKSVEELKTYYHQQELTQSNQWNQIESQLNELTVSNHHHEEFENQVLMWLKSLDDKNINLQTTMENELSIKKAIIDQINSLSESTHEIAARLQQNEEASQKLSLQLNEQLGLQKYVAEKLTNQEEFQTDVLNRLDSQEALTEKILCQINHIRSILFERTNYLATKIDEGYKVTSSYVYKLLTGSDQPLTFFLMNQKKEENQKQSD